MQNDADTQELHFALGNLFRRRGEYQRAVRVHEHLLSRGDLSRGDRDRAQHALAQDFLSAGLLDRAESALQKLEGTQYQDEARLALLAIYERSREWAQAAEVAAKLDASQMASYSTRLAHHLCEQAAEQLVRGDATAADTLLQKAGQTAPDAPRPQIDLAALALRTGDASAAFDRLVRLSASAPTFMPLYADLLQQAGKATGAVAESIALLQERYAETPSLDVLEALVALDARPATAVTGPETLNARDNYVAHLQKQPSLVAATRWLAGELFKDEASHPPVQRALEQASRPLLRYRCAACGFEANQHFWHCPGCQAWDSYPARRVEEL